MIQQVEDEVILVDISDLAIGVARKMDAHRKALLHRAFSVFLYDESGRVLIQRRSAAKYHSAGLWANACCGHPRPHESVIDAAMRRVREELGVESHELREVGRFVYRADVGQGLVEHELDHVLVGLAREQVTPNPDEISAVRWMLPSELVQEVAGLPQAFATWLPAAMRIAGLS